MTITPRVLTLRIASAALLLFCFSPIAYAQLSQSLSVTPPLFQTTLNPGQVWSSYVKVINPNTFPLSVYATPVNFEPSGEEGQGTFLPLVDQAVDKNSLAGWLTVPREEIVIPPEQSIEVPLVVSVPENAAPGGHFAAILIGTKPPETDEVVALKTSQVVTSLFLVRISGDIVEHGSIREFSIEKALQDVPEADFTLRFENDGTVHLQPQGDITIYNMWGKERGFIPVNQKSNYGNVLPKSIRKFSFHWSGESSLTDIGRYKAIATLTYGSDARQSDSTIAYFWVIPVKGTLVTLGFIFGFIFFITWAVRRYIRRAMMLAGYDSREQASKAVASTRAVKKPAHVTRAELVLPIRKGVIDLRKSLVKPETSKSRASSFFVFMKNYRIFIVSLCVVLICASTVVWYIGDVLTKERTYEVTLKKPDGSVTLSSEEVLHDRLSDASNIVIPSSDAEGVKKVRIINASGEPGTGARVALLLEQNGFAIDGISTDQDIRTKSVVVYEQSELTSATAISSLFSGALLSSFTPDLEATSTDRAPLLLIVGEDQL